MEWLADALQMPFPTCNNTPQNMEATGTSSFDLQLVSKYRNALMGFAIVIVVLYHFFNNGGETPTDLLLQKCFSHGYLGVDIFMVVSGLGLTFSMSKNENLNEYYLKRWVKIFPFYTFITFVDCFLIRGESVGLALLRSTTIGYWTGLPFMDWYIPAIVGLYTVYPLLYFHVVKPERYKLAMAIGIVFLAASVVLNYIPLLDWKHYALVYRVPDFILGSMMGIALKKGYKPVYVKRFMWISALTGIILFLALHGYSYRVWLLNLCLTPLYLYLLCHLFDKILSSGFSLMRLLPQALAFLGMFTLEEYRISSSFERLLSNEACPDHHYLYVIFYFASSMILAYLCHKFFNHVNDFLYRKLKG